jgi:hypothetical protein
MNGSIAWHCPKCDHYGEIAIAGKTALSCPNCHAEWGAVEDLKTVFDYCPVCRCRQFYTSKDFNQFMGCMIMLIGIILVPFTYGLSLPVFALVDWLLHKKVPTIINCYKCGCEFRGFPNDKRFKSFLHHIGLKYDKYR